MSNTPTPAATLPMLSPDGAGIADIPVDRADEAQKAGYKHGVDMYAPDGKTVATIPIDQAETAQKAGYRTINSHIAAQGMHPNYQMMALENTPGGADPHNPGNPNLNAIPESQRGAVNDTALKVAASTIPMEAFVTPGLAAPVVSQAKNAAGKFVAGKVAQESTLAGAAARSAPKLVHMSEEALTHFAENYPALTSLAKGLSYAGSAVGGGVSAYELYSHLMEKLALAKAGQ